MGPHRFSWLLWLLVGTSCDQADAPTPSTPPPATAPLRVAVAANFAGPANELARVFEGTARVTVEVSTGSSGKLYAQIENGAPFDIFLSADTERPRRLAEQGLGVPGTQLTYAVGRLALYGPALDHPADGARDLEAGAFEHLALANPETAPYGTAAQQTLSKLGQWDALAPRIVRGENIAQAQHYVETGGAELGFVAFSLIAQQPKDRYWLVPSELHEPIRQDAVLVKRNPEHPQARAYLAFLKSPEGRRIIEAAGYDLE